MSVDESSILQNGLRAFLFDLDGTLRFGQPPGYDTFLQYGRDLGLTFAPEAIRQTERWQHQFWADRPAVVRLFGELGEAGGWLEITRRQLALLGATGPLDDHARAISDRFSTEFQQRSLVPADVPTTLAELRARGYVTGLVSNRVERLGPVAAEHGLDGVFDFTLSAGEAGAWKPDPAIFLRAVELAGVRPQAAAYVGDNYYADVIGSQGAGLLPILYDPRGLFPEASCRVIGSIGELLEL
jgi:FMN phosphatase YigB (HAD superfamily)